MSKINMIQNKLVGLNGGEFQKLMDAYFSKKYKGTLYTIGSVMGNNNTKTGTPDTLIKPNIGNYIFIEYTVQKNNIVSKFKDDIFKCLDEEKTGISKKLIEKIICCCNSRLDTNEIEELISIGRENDVEIEVISLDSIAYKLLEYPFLIKNFFGISIDTQQILELEDFISINDSAKLATPLNIEIFGRKEEIDNIVSSLGKEQIIMITGSPGVGKTRLALEVMERFKQINTEYKLKCLRNNGQNIYDDLNLYFSEPGSYLLMLDDANLLTNIQLILDLFSLESNGIKIKLILTVRDYAEAKVINKISNYSFKIFRLTTLNTDNIQSICEHFGVYNKHYINRINEIAKGNPRLAIMGCKTARKENNLSSLSNALKIVESYYREINTYFEIDLQNEELLKVGAILSFLNHVNLKDVDNINQICKILNQSSDTVIKNVYKLHEMELVDIYDNELVKISDQILSIYIFYLSVIKKQSFSYKTLIETYYPSLKGRIIENINNIFSYFYHEETVNTVKNAVKEIFEERKQTFNEEKLEDFLITFWFALEVEGLIYAKEKIEGFEKVSNFDNISFEIKNSNYHSNIVTLLGCYKNSKYYLDAIDLLLLYLERKPTEFSSVYKTLTENFGFDEISDVQGYICELELFKRIEHRYELEKNILYEKLLIRVIEYFLRLSYEYTRMKDNKNFVFYRIPLILKNNLPELRRNVWLKLKELYNLNISVQETHKILYEFGSNIFNESIDISILRFDKDFIESMITDIDELSIEQSIVFDKIKKVLKRYDVHLNEDVVKKIDTEDYCFYKKVFGEPKFDESDRIAEEEELKHWCKNFTNEDFHKLFTICKDVTSISYINFNEYFASRRMELILKNIPANKKMTVLRNFFDENIKLSVHPDEIIKIEKDLNHLEQLVLNGKFYNKSYWLFCIYKEMSLREPSKELLDKLYNYFMQPEGEVAGFNRDISFLKVFISMDENVFINIIELLLQQDDSTVYSSLYKFIFNCAKNDDYISIYLKDDLKLLSTIYLRFLKIGNHFDYDSSILKSIVRRDPLFLEEILDKIMSSEESKFKFEADIQFSFIWSEENWNELANIVSNIFEKYIQNRQKYFAAIDLLEKLIILDLKSDDSKANLNKWIESKIIKWVDNDVLIFGLFECLTKLDDVHQINWITNLVGRRADFEFFTKLPLLPRSYSWSGSEVPVLRKRQYFYQQIINKLEGIRYLKHKQWLEERINFLEERIKRVKLKELVEDLY